VAVGNRAKIKHDLLIWGRQMSGMPITIAAKKIGVPEAKLIGWEKGDEQPTINQLRKIANVYKQSFAAFFLPTPPKIPKLPLKDYRRLPGATTHDLSHEIVIDVRSAIDRRLIAMDLMELNGIEPKLFDYHANINDGAEKVSNQIRNDLGIELAVQQTWRDPRLGFKHWREALEEIGILVFQSSSIDIADMRGYSIHEDVLPIIVVNRKDYESARIFTVIHELAHLYLRASGLCDLEARTDIPPEEQRLEIFCNDVAANTLVPKAHFENHSLLVENTSDEWTETEISELARNYSVGREMIVRRLLEVGRASKDFYQKQRKQYLEEYRVKKEKSKGGFVPPSIDALSKSGRKYSDLIIRSLKSKKINSTQASEYFGLKLKHIRAISASLGY